MNKKKKGFLCLALCLILTVSFGMQGLRVNATNMSSITSDSIRNKQDQIKQAEKEREQMKSNLSNLEQIKKDLETQKTNLKKLCNPAGSESEPDRTEYCGSEK